MSDPATDADHARKARNSARMRMEERFSAVKGGYAQKGIGARISDQVSGRIKGAAEGMTEVARESRGILAGTAGLLGLWLARKPLAKTGRKLWAKAKGRLDKGF